MESNQPISLPVEKSRRDNFFTRLMDNPVIAKEFAGRMRGGQAFIILISYLTLISLVILLIYSTTSSSDSSVAWDPSFRQGMGKAIFSTVVIMELLLVSFIGPGLTAGAISSEREHQTYDLLRTTLLSARSLVLGKLGSAFAFLFLLILTALPIQGFAFLLGGVGIEEVLVSLLMITVTALAHCTLGIFFSSFMRRTLTATVSSYASILLSIFMMGITFILMVYLGNSFSNHSTAFKNFFTLLIWFLISTNSILAAVISEVILVEQQSLFYTQNSIFGGSTSLLLISPWIIYVLTYIIVTLALILSSIYFVNKPDK